MTGQISVPLTIIGGYLGAGKTTLLNRLLATADGRRLTVLVNDFGGINIDADLIASHDGQTISLTNGCACCTIGDDLVDALERVLAQDNPPDHIVIEASGVAKPDRIAHYGMILKAAPLDGVIVLLDGENIRTLAKDKFVGKTVLHQIRSADLVVINKTDLLKAEELLALEGWVRGIAPDVRMIGAAHGEVSADLILGLNSARSLSQRDEGHDHSHKSWVIDLPHAVDREAFEHLIGELPASVVRAKGFVAFREDFEKPQLFQLVGKRWSISPAPIAMSAPQIVMIAVGETEGVKEAVTAKFSRLA